MSAVDPRSQRQVTSERSISSIVRQPLSAIVRIKPSSKIAEHVVDATLARRAERVEVGPAGRARVGAERQRLHDVAAAPDPPVADDRDLPADLLGDRLDELDRCRRVVELAAAVVRQARSRRRPTATACLASATVWIPFSTIGPSQIDRSHSTSSHDNAGSNCDWHLAGE